MESNSSNQKRNKKITLSFTLSVRPYSHRPFAGGLKEILPAYFFAEELLCPWFQLNFTVAQIALDCYLVSRVRLQKTSED